MSQYNEKIGLVALLLLAFALRLIALNHLPPGLSHDEANNGIAAMQVLAGDRPVFLEINKGIEPLIIYLEALSFYLYGVHPWSMRWVNGVSGLLTVALIYPLTRRLFNRQVAFWAMAGLAVSFWAIFVSRLTLRAILLPPLLTLMLYLLWRAVVTRPRSWLFYGISGAVMGLSLYTYLSSRFVPLLVVELGVVAAFRAWRLNAKRSEIIAHALGGVIYSFVALTIFFPLGQYYFYHRDSFSERANQVSLLPKIMAGDFAPVIENTAKTLGMFTFEGDETDRYNLDSRPIFDWLNGLVFYGGFILTLYHLGVNWLRRPQNVTIIPSLFLLMWLFTMLLPGFITDDSPHFLRTIGALPVTYIFWAIGLTWIGQVVGQRFHRPVYLVPMALWLLMAGQSGYDYFQRWANAVEARQIYGADIAEIADYGKNSYNKEVTAISAAYYRDEDPFRYLLHWQGQPPFTLWFDGQQSIAFPPPESKLAIRYLFADSAPPAPKWLEFLQSFPAESGRAYQLYRLPPDFSLTKVSGLQPVGQAINGDVMLAGYQVLGQVVSGGRFQLLLGWQALLTMPPTTDYTWQARLWDKQGHGWAIADGVGYDAANWQAGIQGLQLLTFRLSGDLPPRHYELTVELVNRQSGQALTFANGDTKLTLTTLMGQLADKPRLVDAAQLPNPRPPDDTANITLRGYHLNQQPSQIEVTLYWQVLRPVHQNQTVTFSLTDTAGQPLYTWPALDPIGGEWPPQQWPPHYWVQDKLTLPVTAATPRGHFQFHVAWSGQPPILLGEIELR